MPALSRFIHSFGVLPLLALMAAPFLALSAPAQTQPPIFPSPAVSGLPGGPGMVSGDFDGDGKPDTAYLLANTIAVALNPAETGPAPAPVSLPSSCTPQTPLVTGDMNKDGKLDIILTCQQGAVALLFGNGDGTFQSPALYPAAGANNIAPPVDLNGDGYPDIIISTPGTTSSVVVDVLLNQGSSSPGALSLPHSYSSASLPLSSSLPSLVIGDFNGDGKQDLFTAAGPTFFVFYGNGDGTLQNGQLVGDIMGSAGVIAAADINHDGITDIAFIGTLSPSYLVVMLGTSDGLFQAQPTLPLALPLFSSQIYRAIVPFEDHSGNTTIDFALVGSSVTTIALGDGTGNFTIPYSYGITGNTVLPELNASGKTDLLIGQSSQSILLLGNGDGTFQAPPTTFLEGTPLNGVFHGTPANFLSADLNGDGLTDLLSINSGGVIVGAIGRGDGTFFITSQTATGSTVLVPGSFHGNGKTDIAYIGESVNATLAVMAGNGDGTFQSDSSTVPLPVPQSNITSGAAGDFNQDGKLDIVLINSGGTNSSAGVLFLAGNGDGTFIPAISSPLPSPPSGPLFVADVNSDNKLDLIEGTALLLGNGDGTFSSQTLNLPSNAIALGDLNGDGIPDIVAGASVYAGAANGTFQSSPFFTVPLAQSSKVISAAIGDVNGDGYPDLLLGYSTSAGTYAVSVSLGDGTGSFTPDSHLYVTGAETNIALGRANNQASAPNELDLLYGSSDAVTTLINQLNPAPSTPLPLPSHTSLHIPIGVLAPSRPISFNIAVSGLSPSGTVSLAVNGSVVGTSALAHGYASLTYTFPATNSYTVTATYSGDRNNQSSSSTISIPIALATSVLSIGLTDPTPGTSEIANFDISVSGDQPTGTVTLSIAGNTIGTVTLDNSIGTFAYIFPSPGTVVVNATYSGDAANLPTSTSDTINVQTPSFYFSSTGSVATITAGQNVTTTLNLSSDYGFNKAITFSCSGLVTGEACIFNPPTVNFDTSGSASANLVVTTTARTPANAQDHSRSVSAVSFAGLLCLTLPFRRHWRRAHILRGLLLVMLAIGLISLSACSSGSGSSQDSGPNPTGTPAGTQTITVTAAGPAGTFSQSIKLQLTIQ